MEIEMIPGTEKGGNEQLQSQPAEETEVLLGQSDQKDSEAPQEKPQQMEAADRQGVDTQEPASSNIRVEVATQIGVDEPEIENIPDFNEEVYDVTPEPSQDIGLVEMESQQQENEEVNQDVATQEPTSLEISVETLRMQQEANPGMDIIPDMDLGEDEKLQSKSLGDTEILEEQLHIEKDTIATLQSQQCEEGEAGLCYTRTNSLATPC